MNRLEIFWPFRNDWPRVLLKQQVTHRFPVFKVENICHCCGQIAESLKICEDLPVISGAS